MMFEMTVIAQLFVDSAYRESYLHVYMECKACARNK